MGHLSSFSHNMEEWRAGLLGREKLLPCHNSHVDWQSMTSHSEDLFGASFLQPKEKGVILFNQITKLGWVYMYTGQRKIVLCNLTSLLNFHFGACSSKPFFNSSKILGKIIRNQRPSLAVSETGHPTMLHTHCSCRHSCSGQNF